MRQRHLPRLWLPRPAIRPPIGTADNRRPHPGGMLDNSPTFQRWVCEFKVLEVPTKGWLKLRDSSAVPSGLHSILSLFPKVETLGSYRVSLREKDLVRLDPTILAQSWSSALRHDRCFTAFRFSSSQFGVSLGEWGSPRSNSGKCKSVWERDGLPRCSWSQRCQPARARPKQFWALILPCGAQAMVSFARRSLFPRPSPMARFRVRQTGPIPAAWFESCRVCGR